ncbi:hypothetical protein J1777_05970 [Comamonas denitrificans]|uniref:Uncharacterized protein n=1 Tax=Comamonas denitrificans TaxID=117506 RepID=A0A939GWG4_9BURK|nr:hypothetical protein [Comamonas denitrificans]MBO1249384.1 hypothetical protein [Comamonas denitrificans]
MNESQARLYVVQGAIRDLPEFQRQGVYLAAAKLREVLAQHNDHGQVALALVVAELQVEGKL